MDQYRAPQQQHLQPPPQHHPSNGQQQPVDPRHQPHNIENSVPGMLQSIFASLLKNLCEYQYLNIFTSSY